MTKDEEWDAKGRLGVLAAVKEAVEETLAQPEKKRELTNAELQASYDSLFNDDDKEPDQAPFEYWNAVEGWVKVDEVRQHFDAVGCGTIYKTAGEGREPVYITPPKRQWVGLTDEEVAEIERNSLHRGQAIRSIEAKLKEKNS